MEQQDKIHLLLSLQEHPENYSDEQLEAMMDDLDSDLDAQAAWKRFEQTISPAVKPSHRWLRIAAIFVGTLFLVGIAVAAWMSLTPNSSPKGERSECAQSVESHVKTLLEFIRRTDIETFDCCLPYGAEFRRRLVPAIRECGKSVCFAIHFYPCGRSGP